MWEVIFLFLFYHLKIFVIVYKVETYSVDRTNVFVSVTVRRKKEYYTAFAVTIDIAECNTVISVVRNVVKCSASNATIGVCVRYSYTLWQIANVTVNTCNCTLCSSDRAS